MSRAGQPFTRSHVQTFPLQRHLPSQPQRVIQSIGAKGQTRGGWMHEQFSLQTQVLGSPLQLQFPAQPHLTAHAASANPHSISMSHKQLSPIQSHRSGHPLAPPHVRFAKHCSLVIGHWMLVSHWHVPLIHVHLSPHSHVSGIVTSSQGIGHLTGAVGGTNLVVVSVGGGVTGGGVTGGGVTGGGVTS